MSTGKRARRDFHTHVDYFMKKEKRVQAAEESAKRKSQVTKARLARLHALATPSNSEVSYHVHL